jgi:hypothetical protein
MYEKKTKLLLLLIDSIVLTINYKFIRFEICNRGIIIKTTNSL